MAYTENTDQFYSHDETLVRENLHDYITIMDPTDMPLFSLLQHVPVTQRVHDTPVDNLSYDHLIATANTTIVHEGKDAFVQPGSFLDPNASYPTAYPQRLKSQLQIQTRAIDVSNTDRAVTHAGIEDPFLYYLYREMLSLGKWAELLAHWGQVANVPTFDGATNQGSPTGGGSSPRQTEGLGNWIARNGVYANWGTPPTNGVVDPLGVALQDSFFSNFYEASGANLSREMFNDKILKPAYIDGMRTNGCLVLCSSRIKALIGEFALTAQGNINERTISAVSRTLVDTVDIVDTDFGRVYVNMDRYMELATNQTVTLDSGGSGSGTASAPSNYGFGGAGGDGDGTFTYSTNDTILVIQPDKWEIGVLRGFGFQPLSPIGDSTKGQIAGEWSLICRTPIAGTGATSVTAP